MPTINSQFRHIDLDLDFRKHPVKNDVLRLVDSAAIEQSIVNLVLMDMWDKPFHPEIRSLIKVYLFEPMTSIVASNIQSAIEDILGHFEPRIFVDDVVVVPDYDEGSYVINITYSPISKPSNLQNMEFYLERVA